MLCGGEVGSYCSLALFSLICGFFGLWVVGLLVEGLVGFEVTILMAVAVAMAMAMAMVMMIKSKTREGGQEGKKERK